jgi:hypothetical protein
MRMCRMRSHAKLVHVRLPHHHCTRIFQELYNRRIVRANEVLENPRRSCGFEVCRADVVFYRNRLAEHVVGDGSVNAGRRRLQLGVCEQDRWLNERIESIEMLVGGLFLQVRLDMLGEGHGGWDASPARCRDFRRFRERERNVNATSCESLVVQDMTRINILPLFAPTLQLNTPSDVAALAWYL